jgi:hypothetical protein
MDGFAADGAKSDGAAEVGAVTDVWGHRGFDTIWATPPEEGRSPPFLRNQYSIVVLPAVVILLFLAIAGPCFQTPATAQI